MSYLKNLSSDFILLQETHINANEQRHLKTTWLSYVYQSTFTSRARGVAKLVHKATPFIFSSMISDPGGRYILVSSLVGSASLVLLNNYAPNFDCPHFFRKVFDIILEYSSTHIILGGDFNCYFDPVLERSSSKSVSPNRLTVVLNNLVSSYDMVEV